MKPVLGDLSFHVTLQDWKTAFRHDWDDLFTSVARSVIMFFIAG